MSDWRKTKREVGRLATVVYGLVGVWVVADFAGDALDGVAPWWASGILRALGATVQVALWFSATAFIFSDRKAAS